MSQRRQGLRRRIERTEKRAPKPPTQIIVTWESGEDPAAAEQDPDDDDNDSFESEVPGRGQPEDDDPCPAE